MEFGEAAAPTIASVDHDEDCYFCRSRAKSKSETNDLKEDPEDDGPVDGAMKFKNDASKLGKAIKSRHPGEKEIDLGGASFPVGVAAHHLIPGNASLKGSTLFKSEEYLWKDGTANGNIGYNINSSPNGVWLPGNYAQRPWGTDGAAFREKAKREPQAYAFAAIEAYGAQFHDAHEKYSEFVLQALDKVYEMLDAGEDIRCPKAAQRKKEKPEDRDPLYVLVNRLNSISQRMKRMLAGPVEGWKRNVYTSRFSEQYMKPH